VCSIDLHGLPRACSAKAVASKHGAGRQHISEIKGTTSGT
jgi:hypothetical protein